MRHTDGGKPWTESEVRILRREWMNQWIMGVRLKVRIARIARALRRTPGSVRSKAIYEQLPQSHGRNP